MERINRFLIENGVVKKYTPHEGFDVNLKTIAVPTGVTKIDRDAFGFSANCIDIIIPETVSYIDDDAFGYIKFINIFGIPESYAHQFVKTQKYTLTKFKFFSSEIPDLPEPVHDITKTPPFECEADLSNLWLWDKKCDNIIE